MSFSATLRGLFDSSRSSVMEEGGREGGREERKVESEKVKGERKVELKGE